ncbi:MAG TPA: DUF2203 domain-containing protein [Candidatus Limnocylindrales bacterium]|nr:DUF2203 domain-containing protein [Candidatus Limnocylindrales bacterium]
MARYYSVDDANTLLGELRPLLERLRQDRDKVAERQRELVAFRGTNGNASHVDELTRREAAIAVIVADMEAAVRRIESWDVTLRDIGSGLIDFPALASGRTIWLCWRLGEDDVAWWHELSTGIAGRRPLAELT